MKYLYLAEKPSTMKAVRNAYNKSDKPLGDIDFFALAGHICRLKEPKEYEPWNVKWAERELPMIPGKFQVSALNAAKVKELQDKIKSTKYDGIIVGTDSDVEGNGIYDLIEQYLGLQNYKTYRFFETDLTEKGIMESMNNLTDYHNNARDVGMTESYRIRSRFDWLIGFNMTVAYTVKAGFLMKVGRVKAPTLKLVYDNCKAIDSFNSKTSYQPQIKTDKPEITALLIGDDNKALAFPTKEEANKVIAKISDKAKVESFEKSIKRKVPEQLYKLSDIQYDAGKEFGYTPERTLELIQSLYETYKVVSYPRTDGRHISSEKSKDFPVLLKAVKAMPELSGYVSKITQEAIVSAQNNKRYVNDEEVQKASHGALIPTGEITALSKLPEDERNVCLMIFKRFLAIFMPPLEEEKSKVVLESNGYRFESTGSKVVNEGFMKLYNVPKDTSLPDATGGQLLDIKEADVHEVISAPPKRLTQASLIKAMENVQKYISEGELKDAMKKAGGIGQPSSRAAIISELIASGYMEDVKTGKGKGLHITNSGRKYIENLGNSSIVSPELSATWEVNMEELRQQKRSYEELYGKIIDYVRDALDELKYIQIEKTPNASREEVGKCPKCGKSVVKLPKGYGCSGYPDCTFSFFKGIAGKEFSRKDVENLLSGKPTEVLHGLKKKDGTKFDAAVMLDKNNDYKLTWAPIETESEFICPKCGKKLIQTPWSYKCSGDDCEFMLWRKFGEKQLTNKQIENLLNGKSTGIIRGMKRRDGTRFDASLIIENGVLTFERTKAEETELKCPKCGKKIIKSGLWYECEDKEGCGFHIYVGDGNKKEVLTIEDVSDLITKKKTKLKTGLISKAGKTYDAYFVLKDDYALGREFPDRKGEK